MKKLMLASVASAIVAGSFIAGFASGTTFMIVPRTPPLLASAPAPTPTPTTTPTPHPPLRNFDDARFRLVQFREDELLDDPLLNEVHRIARIRLGRQSEEPSATYRDLFTNPLTDGIVVFRTERDGAAHHTVIIGRTKPGSATWRLPSLVHSVDWAGHPSAELCYRGQGYRFQFTETDGRLVLTQFWTMESQDDHQDACEPLDNISAVTFYTRDDGMNAFTEERLRERVSAATRILYDVHRLAVARAPQSEALRRTVRLIWTPTDSGFAAAVARDPGDGSITVTIGIESLMSFSEQHLRQTFGHELGHVARDLHSGGVRESGSPTDPGQLTAEAFALKLMGEPMYRRVHLVAMGHSTTATDELIRTLTRINEQYPNS